MSAHPVITPEHWPALITAAAVGKPEVHAQRDAAVVALACVCGLRLSELCGLKLDDVEVENEQLRVHTRILAIPERAWRHLEAYLDLRPEAHTAALFVSRQGQRLSARQARRIIDRAAYEAGLGNAYPRLLRCSCARALLKRGHSPLAVQRQLGYTRRRQAARSAGIAE